jgi:hypothetical protein
MLILVRIETHLKITVINILLTRPLLTNCCAIRQLLYKHGLYYIGYSKFIQTFVESNLSE